VSPEEQRIAIAEACGWHTITFDRGWIKTGDGEVQATIPNYPNDLNAMHGAVKILTDSEYQDYCAYVSRGTGLCRPRSIDASAAERAEAFLKTLNLWKE
jgi:hypothetical protein